MVVPGPAASVAPAAAAAPAATADARGSNGKAIITLETADVGLPLARPTVGIIIPPPEVRVIIEKTAQFVARNGYEFEARIREREINNVKFNFLREGDPYHAYYAYKVADFREGRTGGTETPELASRPASRADDRAEDSRDAASQSTAKPAASAPDEWEFSVATPAIAALDVDVIRLTAQFVARNGRQFLQGLMLREQRNYQFDFLRPQHSLFTYFTKLVEQYSKVMLPPPDIQARLRADAADRYAILTRVRNRADWMIERTRERERVEREAAAEREAFSSIDWGDFAVVQTIDYRADDPGINYPPPLRREDIGARALAVERLEQARQESREAEDMDVEMDLGSDEEAAAPAKTAAAATLPAPQSAPAARGAAAAAPTAAPAVAAASGATPSSVKVRKDYDPKMAGSAGSAANPVNAALSDRTTCPRCGIELRLAEFNDHLRICTLDPRWKEQRDRMDEERRRAESVFVPGSEITEHLRKLAERRTDIFGRDETGVIGVPVGEDAKRSKERDAATANAWDGTQASILTVTAAAASRAVEEAQRQAVERQSAPQPVPVGPAAPAPLPMQAPPVGPSTGFVHPSRVALLQQPLPGQLPMGGVPPFAPYLGGAVVRPPMVPAPIAPAIGGVGPTAAPAVPTGGDEAAEAGGLAKRAKTAAEADAMQLMPEQEFLQRYPEPITVSVLVPQMEDRGEWNLNGQTETFAVSLKEPISALKQLLQERVRMPAGKQKLQLGNLILKDGLSLAYYNVSPDRQLQLLSKERGGKKK